MLDRNTRFGPVPGRVRMTARSGLKRREHEQKRDDNPPPNSGGPADCEPVMSPDEEAELLMEA